jgi:hypothetical protein
MMPQLANLLVRARILRLKRWLPHKVRLFVILNSELAETFATASASEPRRLHMRRLLPRHLRVADARKTIKSVCSNHG